MKKIRITVAVFLVCLSSVSLLAKPSGQQWQGKGGSGKPKRSNVNTKSGRKADKNNDGRVGRKEYQPSGKQRSNVDTKQDGKNVKPIRTTTAK